MKKYALTEDQKDILNYGLAGAGLIGALGVGGHALARSKLKQKLFDRAPTKIKQLMLTPSYNKARALLKELGLKPKEKAVESLMWKVFERPRDIPKALGSAIPTGAGMGASYGMWKSLKKKNKELEKMGYSRQSEMNPLLKEAALELLKEAAEEGALKRAILSSMRSPLLSRVTSPSRYRYRRSLKRETGEDEEGAKKLLKDLSKKRWEGARKGALTGAGILGGLGLIGSLAAGQLRSSYKPLLGGASTGALVGALIGRGRAGKEEIQKKMLGLMNKKKESSALELLKRAAVIEALKYGY